MKIVCLMGDVESALKVEKYIERFRFKRMVRYTTKEIIEYKKDNLWLKQCTKEEFEKYVDKGYIIYKKSIDGHLYGIAEPFGSDKHVITVDQEQYESIKEQYRKVIGVMVIDSVKNQSDNIYNYEYKADVIIDVSKDFADIAVKILKHVRRM